MLNYKDNGLFGDIQGSQRSTAGDVNTPNPKPARTGGFDPVQSGGGMGWGDQNGPGNPMPLPPKRQNFGFDPVGPSGGMGGPQITDFQPRPQGGSLGDFSKTNQGMLPTPNQMAPSPQYGVWDQGALAQTNPQSLFHPQPMQPQPMQGMDNGPGFGGGGPMPLPGGPIGFEPRPRGGSLGDNGPNPEWNGGGFGGGGPMPLPPGPQGFENRPQGGSLGDMKQGPMDQRRVPYNPNTRGGGNMMQNPDQPNIFQPQQQSQQMNGWLRNYLMSRRGF